MLFIHHITVSHAIYVASSSGHFCGMAEMLTAVCESPISFSRGAHRSTLPQVDYSRSSTVWASDKWKGVFKVRWIFVRDIPNSSLRHIRLKYARIRHLPNALLTSPIAIHRSVSQLRTPATRKSYSQRPAKRCSVSSTVTQQGLPCCKTSPSMRCACTTRIIVAVLKASRN